MSPAITEPGGQPTGARPGRHRRSAGANTWTPVVPARKSHGSRHLADPFPDQGDELPALAAPVYAGASTSFESTASGASLARTAPPAPLVDQEAAHFSGLLSLDAQDVSALGSAPAVEFGEDPSPDGPYSGGSFSGGSFSGGPLSGDTAEDEGSLFDDLLADDAPEPEPYEDVAEAVVPAAPQEPTDLEVTGPILAAFSDEPPTVRRTKVTLTPAIERQDDVRVYHAPPLDGLSKFDLGTVPASVTPPRSWRKAAWFATVSSGGVVVALLVAGSYFVGQPTQGNIAINGWPRLPGIQYDDGYLDSPSERRTDRTTASTAQSDAPPRQQISDAAARSVPGSTTLPAMPTTPTSAPGSSTSGSTPAPTSTGEPQKPPPTSAERETQPAEFYSFPPDAATMGNRTETFFNEITEDPEKAWQETGGSMYAEGPDGIAARYADIAYFDIKHIYIDQRKRITVSTVDVYWKDGTISSEQRTLRFEEGDRITSD